MISSAQSSRNDCFTCGARLLAKSPSLPSFVKFHRQGQCCTRYSGTARKQKIRSPEELSTQWADERNVHAMSIPCLNYTSGRTLSTENVRINGANRKRLRERRTRNRSVYHTTHRHIRVWKAVENWTDKVETQRFFQLGISIRADETERGRGRNQSQRQRWARHIAVEEHIKQMDPTSQ